MTNNLPEWLKRGQLVEFAFAVGEIIDVAISPERAMVLVSSPKGIWRNHPSEWLEYKEGALKPATLERAERDLALYREYLSKMLIELDKMETDWVRENSDTVVAGLTKVIS